MNRIPIKHKHRKFFIKPTYFVVKKNPINICVWAGYLDCVDTFSRTFLVIAGTAGTGLDWVVYVIIQYIHILCVWTLGNIEESCIAHQGLVSRMFYEYMIKKIMYKYAVFLLEKLWYDQMAISHMPRQLE